MIYRLARQLSTIPPGTYLRVSRWEFWDYDKMANGMLRRMDGPRWSAAERIMENIPGSAFEFRYWEDPISGDIVFARLRQPLNDGSRTYVSPDRRDRFSLGPDGRWWPIAQQLDSGQDSRAAAASEVAHPQGFEP